MTRVGSTPDRYVGCSGESPNYATITLAIAAASDGEVIEVCAGTYDETLTTVQRT